jgi:putative oxidoreductase
VTIAQRVARPLLAGIFIVGGLDAYREPKGKLDAARSVLDPLAAVFPIMEGDPEQVVKANGAVQVGATTLLAMGKAPRLAALTLMGSLIPTTLAGHRFRTETDDARRVQQRINFFKNLGVMGGLLLTALGTGGPTALAARTLMRPSRVAALVAAGRAVGSSPAFRRAAHKIRHGHAARVTARDARAGHDVIRTAVIPE